MTIVVDLINRLGADSVITDPADMQRYLEEARGLYRSHALAVVRPRSTEEVAAILSLCNQTGTGVVPQGGNTGLVAGSVTYDGIILSLERMNRIVAIDRANATMTVEAGAILAHVQQEADRVGLFFPLSLAAEGSCTIGGNLATNAGGTGVLRYGNARELCLGIEAVLADGRIVRDLGGLRKDNSGYDLKQLFIGSEGTLGIITQAVLRLHPRRTAKATAFLGLASPEMALRIFERMQAACGDVLTTFELLPDFGLACVLAHMSQTVRPLQGVHAWYALVELASPHAGSGLEERLAAVLEAGFEADELEDATIGASDVQSAMLWRLREGLSEAQGKAGPVIKHDVSVPVSAIPAFLAQAAAVVEQTLPGTRPCPFGHMGDGNIHFNLSPPEAMAREDFLQCWQKLNSAVHDVTARFNGSIAAEHGVGLSKRDELPLYKDPVSLAVMKTLKNALDPNGILNPSKVIAGAGEQMPALPSLSESTGHSLRITPRTGT